MHTKAPEGIATGASTGGALGWIAGIGALAIPEVGPFIAAGPIMAALSGAAAGAPGGGVAGGLVSMGIPELDANRYQGKINEGHILISVHSESSDQSTAAREVFIKTGGQDICVTGEDYTRQAPGIVPQGTLL